MAGVIGAGQALARRGPRVAVLLGAITLTAAWLSVWVALLGPLSNGALPFSGPLQELYALAGAALAWRLAASSWERRLARGAFIVAGALAALLLVWAAYYPGWAPLDPRWLVRLAQAIGQSSHLAPSLATALAALALWTAGGRLGASDLDAEDLRRCFQTGLGGLLLGLIVAALGGVAGRLAGQLSAATTVFFVAALLSLPLAQLRSAQERGRAAGLPVAPLDLRWLPLVCAGALLVIAAALLVSGAVSGRLLAEAGAAFARLPDLVLTLARPLIIALGYLVAALVWLLDHLLSRRPRTAPPPQPAPPPRSLLPSHTGVNHLPMAVNVLLTALAIGLVVAVALLVLGRMARGANRPRAAFFEEERDSVWSWDELGAGWRALLDGMGARLRRAVPRRGESAGPPRTVRQAYRRLLARGATLGYARKASETPHEYLRRLRGLEAPCAREATLLTTAYLRARYAAEEPSPAEVAQALEAWQRLDAALAAWRPPGDAATTSH